MWWLASKMALLEQIYGCWAGAGCGGEIGGEFGIDMYMLLYLKWITNKDPTVQQARGTLLNVMVAAWMGGEFLEEWIHVYAWLSPFTVHLNLLQHCLLIGYTPVQNKKLKTWFSLRVTS